MIASTKAKPKEKRSLASPVRVGIYVRKSTDHGLKDSEFTTLDAQREAVEGYITSKRAEGWQAVPEVYADGGFSGATTDRPALQRLFADVEAGNIDVLAVYKLDRLSRSQLHFMQIIDFLKKHGVAFVSVTESFDTSNNIGRMILSILAVFAEFERERIRDRTRDKLRAATARGMWTGGIPVLGYDVKDKRLVINKREAKIVRGLFEAYLMLGSMMAVVAEADRRGWKTKTRVTKAGEKRPGKPFTFSDVRALLQRPVYIGKIKSRDQVFEGQHEAIIDQKTWDAVQALIRKNTKNGGSYRRRTPPKNMLSGILYCGVCGARMTHEVSTSSGGDRKYRYYRCATMVARGSQACPSSRVPAGDIEGFIVDRIREIGTDPRILAKTIAAGKVAFDERKPEIHKALKALGEKRERLKAKQRRLVLAIGDGEGPKSLVKELEKTEAAIDETKANKVRLRDELAALTSQTLDEASLKKALADFDDIWGELFPEEQARVVQLLIEKIACDVPGGQVQVTFRPGGIKVYAEERAGDDDGDVSS